MKRLIQTLCVLFSIFCATLFISGCSSGNQITGDGQEILVDEVPTPATGDGDCETKTTYYADADTDGYGDGNSITTACAQPDGYVASAGDCDDDNAAVNPGVDEVCGDGIDNNCDNTVDCEEVAVGNPSPNFNYDILPGTVAAAPLGVVDDLLPNTDHSANSGTHGVNGTLSLDTNLATGIAPVGAFQPIEYTFGTVWNGFIFNNDNQEKQELGDFASYLPLPRTGDSKLTVQANALSTFDHNIIYQRAFITRDDHKIMFLTGGDLKVDFSSSGTKTQQFCPVQYLGLTNADHTTNYEYVAAILGGIEYSSNSNMGVLEAGVSWESNTDSCLQNILKISNDGCINYVVDFTGQDARATIRLTFIAFNSSDVTYGEEQTTDIQDDHVQTSGTLTDSYPLHGAPDTWGEQPVLFSGFKNFKLRHSCWDNGCNDPGTQGYHNGDGLGWLGLVITDTTLSATQNAVSVNLVASELFKNLHYDDYDYDLWSNPELVVTAQTLTLGLKPSQHSQASSISVSSDGTSNGVVNINCGLEEGVWTCQ